MGRVTSAVHVVISTYFSLLLLVFLKYTLSVDVNTHVGLLYDGATIATLDNNCRYAGSTVCNDVWSCTQQICKYFKTSPSYITVTPVANSCYLNETSAFATASANDILHACILLTTIGLYAQIVILVIGLACQCHCCSKIRWFGYGYTALVTLSKGISLTAAILFAISSLWLEKGFPRLTQVYGTLVLAMLIVLNGFDLIWIYFGKKPKEKALADEYTPINA